MFFFLAVWCVYTLRHAFYYGYVFKKPPSCTVVRVLLSLNMPRRLPFPLSFYVIYFPRLLGSGRPWMSSSLVLSALETCLASASTRVVSKLPATDKLLSNRWRVYTLCIWNKQKTQAEYSYHIIKMYAICVNVSVIIIFLCCLDVSLIIIFLCCVDVSVIIIFLFVWIPQWL